MGSTVPTVVRSMEVTTMALSRRARAAELPELWRRFFDIEDQWMRVEEFRDGDTYVIKAELPGIDPEKDVDISVAEGMLTMRAEREEKSESKDKGAYRSEFRYGSFSRSIPLPRGVNTDEVLASYTDGILEVRVPLPKGDEGGARSIPVSRR
jgi:HSP20 family protein